MQQSHKDWNEEWFRNGIVLNFLNETENLSKGLGTLYTTNSVTFTSEALSVRGLIRDAPRLIFYVEKECLSFVEKITFGLMDENLWLIV